MTKCRYSCISVEKKFDEALKHGVFFEEMNTEISLSKKKNL